MCQARILLTEGGDVRVLRAAALAQGRGLCRPAVVGWKGEVRALAEEHGIAVSFPVLEPEEDPALGDYVKRLATRLVARGGTPEEAADLAVNPLYYACLRVAAGESDGAVMGAVATTAETLRAALRTVGARPGLRTVSSCFLMVLADGSGL
ncbi:MAG: phosphate acetyltransferase, partial [Acidobacteria bacterium]|nr:phosphate acetyltransferase [Acidobacteriota bacterium]